MDEDCNNFGDCFTDGDGDNFGGTATTANAVAAAGGATATAGACAAGAAFDDTNDDCQDGVSTVNPGIATEVCDGYDQDCTGGVPANETDDETTGDGYVECGTMDTVVANALGGGDCDDNDATIYPYAGDADETDGIDSDCDGMDCAAGESAAGGPWTNTGAPYFVFCDSLETNIDAIADCQAAGHDGLAEPQSSTETTYLVSLLGTGTPWLGLNDAATSGDFVYDSGAGLDACDSGQATIPLYCNWNATQPDNAANDDCVTADLSGEWFDKSCSETNTFTCETR